jgi:CheY-like chemotaxis protein
MDTSQKHLLVVDDIPDILNLLDTTLKFKGYRVTTARNGEEALDAIKKERPALIVTDILMPKMDGFSLVHRLRISPETRDIPVVFLSATYVLPEDKEFALTLGVTRFIEKPVDLETFLPVISELLSQGTTAFEPLNEFDFYDGYRKRLEIKLKHKNIQIARDEHLIGTLPEEERKSIKINLGHSISERDEIQHLLDEINEQLENIDKSK